MQRHRCFWIEGRGIRMIFGIINDANNGEVNGDKDGAKMHNEREDGRKKSCTVASRGTKKVNKYLL